MFVLLSYQERLQKQPSRMSPVPGRPFDAGVPATWFRDEWKSPSNYAFTILLLLGGDVVARALAQLAGSRLNPVAFSFDMPTEPPLLLTQLVFSH